MKKFKSLREKKLKATDYDANTVKSKSGGWLPKITAKGNYDVLYTGEAAFKSEKIAKAAAEAYLTGYALGGKKSADKMMNAHIKNNKKNLVDPSVLDFMEDVNEDYTSLLSVEINEGLTGDLKKAEDAMGGSKTKEQGIQFVMDTMKVNKKKATQLVDRILKMKGSQKGKVTFKEANMSDVKKQLGKVKGLSKDAYDQLITLPMPVLTTMVNQLSGIVSSTQVESVNENQVMNAQFKVGDMPNSDLNVAIEKLKRAKKKAEGNKSKVSDPVLVKSLEDVMSTVDKTIKDAEKAEASASKLIAKVAPSIKRTFELLSRKKYLVASTEVEGDTVEEAMGAFPQVGSKFALKKKHVKMIQDIIKSKGNAAVSHIETKMGYSKSAAEDLIALAQGRAIYGKKLGMTGSGVVESLKEQLGLEEAFNIDKGTNVKMKAGSDKDLYGKVIKQIKVNGKPGVTVQWKNGVKGNFRMDQFAAVSMDRKADYQVQDDGVRF